MAANRTIVPIHKFFMMLLPERIQTPSQPQLFQSLYLMWAKFLLTDRIGDIIQQYEKWTDKL
jgi:hypothetical protein